MTVSNVRSGSGADMGQHWPNIGANMTKFAARFFFLRKDPSHFVVLLLAKPSKKKKKKRHDNSGHKPKKSAFRVENDETRSNLFWKWVSC